MLFFRHRTTWRPIVATLPARCRAPVVVAIVAAVTTAPAAITVVPVVLFTPVFPAAPRREVAWWHVSRRDVPRPDVPRRDVPRHDVPRADLDAWTDEDPETRVPPVPGREHRPVDHASAAARTIDHVSIPDFLIANPETDRAKAPCGPHGRSTVRHAKHTARTVTAVAHGQIVSRVVVKHEPIVAFVDHAHRTLDDDRQW